MWYYEMIVLWLQTSVTLMLSLHGKKILLSVFKCHVVSAEEVKKLKWECIHQKLPSLS